MRIARLLTVSAALAFASIPANAEVINGGSGGSGGSLIVGSGVAAALALTLNGSGAISATTSPVFVTPTLVIAVPRCHGLIVASPPSIRLRKLAELAGVPEPPVRP
jgi:hypothetical protein